MFQALKAKSAKKLIWFDTEFIEDGKTIDLLSIGMIDDKGNTLYFESSEADHSKASDWVRDNVIPKLLGTEDVVKSRDEIRQHILEFAGPNPRFIAYYASYDWVVLCQLFGTMMDLPDHWPMYCLDLKQACLMQGDPKLPPPTEADDHNALKDAIWTKQAWDFLHKSYNNKKG